MAQSVAHLTLDFGVGHDLTVSGFGPHVRLCTGSVEPAWDSLFLPAPPLLERAHTRAHTHARAHTHILSLKINKLKKILNK